MTGHSMEIGPAMLAQRESLHDRFRAHSAWRASTRDAVPAWFDVLLTDLVLAIGDNDIRYFSAGYREASDGQGSSMEVIVFTDLLVAYATVEPDSLDEPGQFEVVVAARRSLRSFWITTSPDYAVESGSSDGVHIAVSYPDFARTLPLGESDWPHRDADTAELLRCLRLDLTG